LKLTRSLEKNDFEGQSVFTEVTRAD
jgi:hypothetical protein